jgi:hypothetical protein
VGASVTVTAIASTLIRDCRIIFSAFIRLDVNGKKKWFFRTLKKILGDRKNRVFG